MKELPKSYFRQDVAEKEQGNWNERQASLQKSVQELSELMNTTFSSVEQLEGVTPEWLEDQISKSESNLRTVLGAGTFIPAGISKQFAEKYEEIRSKAAGPVEHIVTMLAYLKENGISLKMDRAVPGSTRKKSRPRSRKLRLISLPSPTKRLIHTLQPSLRLLTSC